MPEKANERRRSRQVIKEKKYQSEEERLRVALAKDGYLDAMFAGRIYKIEEIGVDISLASEPLRWQGEMNGADLLKAAWKKGLNYFDVLDILSYQLAICRSKHVSPSQDLAVGIRRNPIDWVRAARIISSGDKLPFFVGQTTMGILTHDLAENIKPQVFLNNFIRFRPDAHKAIQLGIDDTNRVRPLTGTYPNLAGTVLVESKNGDRILGRESHSILDRPMWGIGGGRYDSMVEVGGLEEIVEETRFAPEIVRGVVPLGTADQEYLNYGQYSFDERKEQPNLPKRYVGVARHLNVMWRLKISDREMVENPPPTERYHSPWEWLSIDKITELARIDRLTPLATCALICAGHLNLADFPHISMPNR